MTNILPKKKWHVRTTENIERVRRDEAKAAEEERERESRQRLAEREARTTLLRSKARKRLGVEGDELKELEDQSNKQLTNEEGKEGETKIVGFDGGGEIDSLTGSGGHVNFFQNLEDGEKMEKGNEEHEAEKKREQEEYEKKVGYLTYLGQDTEELTGSKVWYVRPPKKEEDVEEEKEKKDVDSKFKNFLDPMLSIKKHLGREHESSLTLKKHVKPEVSLKRKRSSSPEKKKKKKKDKKKKSKKSKHYESDKSRKKKRKRHHSTSSDSSSSSEEDRKKKSSNLAKLRKERLEREKKERCRANKLLNPDADKKASPEPGQKVPTLKQSYNSQFNPTIARQNKLDPKEKYWLQWYSASYICHASWFFHLSYIQIPICIQI